MWVHSIIINSIEEVEATQCPSIDNWIKKMWYIFAMGYYSAMRAYPSTFKLSLHYCINKYLYILVIPWERWQMWIFIT